MDFEWDETKNSSNKTKHGVAFEMASHFPWDAAIIEVDLRRDYGEDRFIARGLANDGTGYHIAFTVRDGKIRIITMRQFSRKDYRRYGA
ncbi:uncharacterized DUF497 family protein [Devosia sp. UYZn731]|uniref:BrnT family toxin n=1 Tax=Devosia sp. UYZn731 TaxID=3156345 RepID=UPI003399273B